MVTTLCKLALKYGTDKCPGLKHSYTSFYYQLLKDKKRQEIKKILEMGIGYFPGMPEKTVIFDPTLKREYHRGASLYMWRDFFPNAQIFGADNRPETLFEDVKYPEEIIKALPEYDCQISSFPPKCKDDRLIIIRYGS